MSERPPIASIPYTAPGEESDSFLAGTKTYATGLLLSLLLTGAAFWSAHSHALWGPGIPVVLVVLAIAQMGVHLVFFLQINTAPNNANNILILAFGIVVVFLVIAGSLWIISNLNENMLPMDSLIKMQP